MTNLTVDSLQSISAALGVEPGHFFNERQKSAKASDAVVPGGNRSVSEIEGGARLHFGMSPSPNRHLLLPELVSLLPEPAAGASDRKALSHGTEEFIYVLSGVLTVNINGRTHRMFQGDSVAFRPSTQRRWHNDTDCVTEILLVRYPNPRHEAGDESEAREN
jgi:mannose-6-phosphate isomerase-like protein (cupin superfamily)